MKLQSNWKYKNLETLEKKTWDYLKDEGSYLLTTCYALTKKPVGEFDIEDLRIMIGQGFGLNHLIPLAIEVLEENIFAEGHFYEGDLLNSVLNSSEDFWKTNKESWAKVCELFRANFEMLENFDTTKSIKKNWFGAYSKFEQINKN